MWKQLFPQTCRCQGGGGSSSCSCSYYGLELSVQGILECNCEKRGRRKGRGIESVRQTQIAIGRMTQISDILFFTHISPIYRRFSNRAHYTIYVFNGTPPKGREACKTLPKRYHASDCAKDAAHKKCLLRSFLGRWWKYAKYFVCFGKRFLECL